MSKSNEKPKAFDDAIPDDFIKKTAILFADKKETIVALKMFEGNKSKDFYVGMAAGIQAALSAITMFPLPNIQDALNEIKIAAIMNASEKTSTILTPYN